MLLKFSLQRCVLSNSKQSLKLDIYLRSYSTIESTYIESCKFKVSMHTGGHGHALIPALAECWPQTYWTKPYCSPYLYVGFPPKTEGQEDMIDFCMSTLYLCPLTEFHSILDSSEMPFDKAGLSCDNNDTVKSFSFHAFIHWIHFSCVFCSRGSTHGIHWTVVLDRKKMGKYFGVLSRWLCFL